MIKCFNNQIKYTFELLAILQIKLKSDIKIYHQFINLYYIILFDLLLFLFF